MRSSEDPVAMLLHEWTICDAGLARYDTLAFNIRSWAITVYGAALAASIATDEWRIVAPLVLILVGACWWTDGLYRTLQDQYMARTTEIQIELQKSLEASSQSEYLRRFMIEREWIGPLFAAVHKETRDIHAIAHMAWQPHIRWFYAPLFGVALLASLWAADKPLRDELGVESVIPRVVILFLVGCIVPTIVWLYVRSTRRRVNNRRRRLKEEAEAARETRLLQFTPESVE